MGFTLEELSARMSNQEFELRMALEMIRQDECPNCGVEPRDMMEYGTQEVHCPVCKNNYHKVRKLGTKWLLSEEEPSAV